MCTNRNFREESSSKDSKVKEKNTTAVFIKQTQREQTALLFDGTKEQSCWNSTLVILKLSLLDKVELSLRSNSQ